MKMIVALMLVVGVVCLSQGLSAANVERRQVIPYPPGWNKKDPCEDQDPKCATYVKGFCTDSKYINYGKTKCQKFCDYCQCQHLDKKYRHEAQFLGTHGCTLFTCDNGRVTGVNFMCTSWFNLPSPKCEWKRDDDYCCSLPSCPPGINIAYPDWWGKEKEGFKKVNVAKTWNKS